MRKRFTCSRVGTALMLGMTIAVGPAPSAYADYEGYTGSPPLESPVCGKNVSRENKIKRNVKLAADYFHFGVAFEHVGVDQILDILDANEKAGKPGLMSGMNGCGIAEGATFLNGALDPPPSTASLRFKMADMPPEIDVIPWKEAYPNVHAVAGSFRVISAWENGVAFMNAWEGTAKDDGDHWYYWEFGIYLVDDEGRITHLELWDDGSQLENGWKKVTGKSYAELKGNPQLYWKIIRERTAAITKEHKERRARQAQSN